ncbi:hypothetical protein D0Z03_000961 [Geotrichum reessii]|nr:hypothetical protein D0Z03_000961 [Galactomyces reessii]
MPAIAKDTTKLIAHYARFAPTPLSLAQMAQFGKTPTTATVFRASQFMTDELPVRIAHKVHELENLPPDLVRTTSIQRVLGWYVASFQDILRIAEHSKTVIAPDIKSKLLEASHNAREQPVNTSFFKTIRNRLLTGFASPLAKYDGDQTWPPEVYRYLDDFTNCLNEIRTRHDAVVTTVAQGIKDYSIATNKNTTSPSSKASAVPMRDIQSFLDRFFMSRIGIRVLVGQQLALMKGHHSEDYVGIICTNTNINDTIKHSVKLAQEICEDWYGLFEAPKVIIECDPNLNLLYIPAHLSHMIFEVVKNSLRAVVEKYGPDVDSAEKYPPVTIVVGDGTEDFTIRISDQGGGIPRSVQKRVWLYNYTTVEDTPDISPEFSEPMLNAPMAGFGYGLPITRLYARYFGGDVDLQSIEGYGTDVYMHLHKLSTRELIY